MTATLYFMACVRSAVISLYRKNDADLLHIGQWVAAIIEFSFFWFNYGIVQVLMFWLFWEVFLKKLSQGCFAVLDWKHLCQGWSRGRGHLYLKLPLSPQSEKKKRKKQAQKQWQGDSNTVGSGMTRRGLPVEIGFDMMLKRIWCSMIFALNMRHTCARIISRGSLIILPTEICWIWSQKIMSDVRTKCLTPLVDFVRHMSDVSEILSHALTWVTLYEPESHLMGFC